MSSTRDSDAKQALSATLSTAQNPTKHEGPLSKWTNVVRGWQYRWFVLDPVHSTLDYYLTEEDRSQTPRASIKLAGSTIVPSHEDAQTFILHAANGEVYKLKAHDVKDRQKWVNMIRCVISFSHGQRNSGSATSCVSGGDQQSSFVSRSSTINSFGGGGGNGGGADGVSRGESLVRTSSIPRSVHFATEPASMKFDEPFAPARHVISKIRDKRSEMCRLIEVGGEDCAVACLSPDLLLLKATSLASWDCLHQCVFALMNTDALYPDSGGDLGFHDPSSVSSGFIEQSSLEATPTYSSTIAAGTGGGAMMNQAALFGTNTTVGVVNAVATGTGMGTDSAQHSRSSSVVDQVDMGIDNRTPSPSIVVPGVATAVLGFGKSSSSGGPSRNNSTGAADGRAQRGSLPPGTSPAGLPQHSIIPSGSAAADDPSKSLAAFGTSPKLSPKASISQLPSLKRQDSRPPVFSPDEEEITDADEEDVAELGSVESEKSVILHLIGQLKIGMDLTKVTLPTFILERRSLLEMFADYLGHAYILLRISDMKTEEQRMLGVLEWYLTSLHIVRKGTQAKKPYNPIIGETFHCSYKVPNESTSGSSAGNDQLRLKYVGEQVSHHPPVTAFYAECPEKKICMSASIYTQSKFYGLSIGVNLVGTAKLYLVEFGEEYTFTLPSAYARSILTVPWCELGGKVLLECKKSGYSADIVFHTKPFYGGKLHRVTADVTNGQSKVVCKVSGEWNSNYEFTMSQDGTQRSVDVTSLPVIKKRCRPIDKQDPFESRRLWRKVTEALAVENIDQATFEKNALEEIQRKGEKERKVLDVRFPNKFFHLEDGTWIFNDPLYRKIAPTK